MAGGRYFKYLGSGVRAVETYTKSCEMFNVRKRTWSFCADLPFPLAYADVISTPKGAWILGGKKDPFIIASVMIFIHILLVWTASAPHSK